MLFHDVKCIMTWFVLGLLSVLALATAELTQQHLLNVKNAFTERTSAVLTFLFQSVFVLPILFLSGKAGQFFSIFAPSVLPRVCIVTLLSSFAMVFYLRSFKVKNISISAIFTSFSVVVSTVLGIVFLSESTEVSKLVGIALVLSAIVLANWKNAVLEKHHFYGLAAGAMFGVVYTLDKNIVSEVHPLIYLFWSFLMIVIWGVIFGGKEIVRSVKGKGMRSYVPVLASGFGYLLFNICTFTAYSFGGEVGRIDAINNSQVFLIILFEFFILKHTEGTVRKLASATMAILGVIILGLVK